MCTEEETASSQLLIVQKKKQHTHTHTHPVEPAYYEGKIQLSYKSE